MPTYYSLCRDVHSLLSLVGLIGLHICMSDDSHSPPHLLYGSLDDNLDIRRRFFRPRLEISQGHYRVATKKDIDMLERPG